jgi:hypothetical protein
MDIITHGSFAKIALASIQEAEALQGRAVAYINEAFEATRDEELSVENLTWEKFVDQLSSANENGTLEELNDKLLENIIMPIVEQAMAEPQEGTQ